MKRISLTTVLGATATVALIGALATIKTTTTTKNQVVSSGSGTSGITGSNVPGSLSSRTPDASAPKSTTPAPGRSAEPGITTTNKEEGPPCTSTQPAVVGATAPPTLTPPNLLIESRPAATAQTEAMLYADETRGGRSGTRLVLRPVVPPNCSWSGESRDDIATANRWSIDAGKWMECRGDLVRGWREEMARRPPEQHVHPIDYLFDLGYDLHAPCEFERDVTIGHCDGCKVTFDLGYEHSRTLEVQDSEQPYYGDQAFVRNHAIYVVVPHPCVHEAFTYRWVR